MISISNLTKKFGATTALDDVSLEIKQKEFFGLLGPNGAGKSTLMNLLIGYLGADTGEILIDGEKMLPGSLELRKKIGLVPQTIALYEDISAKENLEIFGSFYGISKKDLRYIIAEKLKTVGLFERRNDTVKSFSGGMKRRLNLAASLLHDPGIILCDEPTVGIDPSRGMQYSTTWKLKQRREDNYIYNPLYGRGRKTLYKDSHNRFREYYLGRNA